MSDHQWCRDVRRDEAVRAAEDAAAVPAIMHRDLPEVVAALTERVAELTTKHNALADLARLDAGWLKANEQRLTAERDAARARVAELEAAAAVRPMGWIARHEQSPPVGKYVMCRWDVSARPGYAREVGYGVAKRGPDGMWRAPSGVEKIAPMHWMPLLPGVEGGDAWEAPLASAPAANAGGEKPQPPRVWLTEEERDAVRWIIDFARHNAAPSAAVAHCHIETAEALLARSTPRVKVPNLLQQNTWQSRDSQWIAAIRAAGVEVEG